MKVMHEVKAEVIRRGLTYRDVSKMLDMDYSRMINFLNGYIAPTEAEIEKIESFMSGKAVGDE